MILIQDNILFDVFSSELPHRHLQVGIGAKISTVVSFSDKEICRKKYGSTFVCSTILSRWLSWSMSKVNAVKWIIQKNYFKSVWTKLDSAKPPWHDDQNVLHIQNVQQVKHSTSWKKRNRNTFSGKCLLYSADKFWWNYHIIWYGNLVEKNEGRSL